MWSVGAEEGCGSGRAAGAGRTDQLRARDECALARGAAMLRDMDGGDQVEVPLSELTERLSKYL